MKRLDLEYLCRTIGNLAGIPVRIYRGRLMTYFYSIVDFPNDPIKPYVDKVFEIEDSIGYFTTPYFNYYGIVRAGRDTIVIGPSRQTPMSEHDLRALAFACDVSSDRVEDFLRAMKSLVQMPLGSIIQILCTLNYVINGEKRSLEDVTICDVEKSEFDALTIDDSLESKSEETAEYSSREIHNTLTVEQNLMQMISRGDVGALCEWFSHAPGVRGGVIANDALRQLKNTFIVTATLASRAAIKGGLDVDDALSLSDEYIRKCELLTTTEQIFNLQYRMVLDYARKVEHIRLGRAPTKLMMQITNYVRHNLSHRISVSELAKSLYVSRPHLSARFKQETGMTLSDFILKERLEEALRLLRYTDKSLSQISDYLGFSSQSHFSKLFKKHVGKTPREYRNSHL